MDLLPVKGQNTASIKSFPSRLTRDQAAALLDSAAPFGLGRILRRACTGPLRSIADVYVPFRIYRVETENALSLGARLIAVDCVNGTLDPYRFDFVPHESKLVCVQTKNSLKATLREEKTGEIASDHVLREIYRAEFLRLAPIRLRAELLSREFYIPFWIGFFGRREAVRLRALDGVSRRMQGAKACAFFMAWLSS
jgi:hypothetical protein